MEYKCKVQYLESTGTQYIDTGVKPDFANGDKIEIRVYKSEGTSGMGLFGSRQTPALNGLYALGTHIVSCDTSGYIAESFLENGLISMSVDDTYIRYGDTEIAQSKRITCAYQMYLFALNDGGRPLGIYSGMKLYDWKYYRNGVLAQHLIPVLDPNNFPCLYDTISGQLFYNKGTGQFLYGAVLGPVIPAIPFLMRPLSRVTGNYARKLQYLENTGTQYINTGIAPDFAGGDSVEIHCYAATSPGGYCAFGSRETNVLNGVYLLGFNNLVVCDNSGYTAVSMVFQAPGELSMSITDNTITSNGTAYTMPRHVTVGLPIYLFALNNYGGGAWGLYYNMRLYDWKYYRNGTLAQHLIPVLDRSGVPCLYDTVTRTLKYNAGTGTFNYA